MKYFLAVLTLCLLSCNVYKKEIPTGSPFPITNVYANPHYDHENVTKALLLPIHNPHNDEGVKGYEKELISSTLKNFGKFNYFHLQYDSKHVSLPYQDDGFNLQSGEIHRMKLGELGREYRAQGILKLSIAEFRPFFPMFIKIKSTLIDSQSAETIWIFDHVFDTSDANIVNGMRLWWNTTKAGGSQFAKFESAFSRPSAFLDYVFYSMAKSYGDVRKHNYKAIKKQKMVQQEKLESLEKLKFKTSR